MPFHARHDLGVPVGVDDQDFRMSLRFRGRGMDMQVTEEPPEGLMLVQGHFLIAEKDHLMLHQRVMDLAKCLIAERLGDVDTGDLGADHRADRIDLDGLIGHVTGSSIRVRPCRSLS